MSAHRNVWSVCHVWRGPTVAELALMKFASLSATRFLCAAALCVLATIAHAAEVMPPKPELYFNDYAKVVSTPVAQKLDRQLEDFEKATSIQVVVAIFPKMDSPSSLEDYVHRMSDLPGLEHPVHVILQR